MPSKTRSYREALLESLSDPLEAVHYLNAAINDSPEMFLKALRNVAQSRRMAKVARDAGVTRESLYRATSEIGNPTLDTLDSVLSAMGIKIRFVEADDPSISPIPSGDVPTSPARTSECAEIGSQGSGARPSFLLIPAGPTTLRPSILGAGWGQNASTVANAPLLLDLNSGSSLVANSDLIFNTETANPAPISSQFRAELQNAYT